MTAEAGTTQPCYPGFSTPAKAARRGSTSIFPGRRRRWGVASRTVSGPIRVDLDELDQLAQTLRRVQEQLGSLAQDFGRFDAAIGAPKVKAKLQEVAGNWSKARQRVNEEIGRLAAMAEFASATYKEREQAIIRAATGTAGD